MIGLRASRCHALAVGVAIAAMVAAGGCGSDNNKNGSSTGSPRAPTTQAPATTSPSTSTGTTSSTPTSPTTTQQSPTAPKAGSGGGTPSGTAKPDNPPPSSPAGRFNKYCSAHPGACGD